MYTVIVLQRTCIAFASYLPNPLYTFLVPSINIPSHT